MADPTASTGGQLLVVSTPIGNLGDITLRALDSLRAADLILAEDTRTTRKLLERYELGTPMLACHEHNEAAITPRILERLANGEAIALVSDAGTPLRSAPGRRLVSSVIDAGHQVIPVPGASALLPALVASGLDPGRFTFLGFLARKGVHRAEEFELIATSPVTTVLYEAPRRLAETLAELAAAAGANRKAAVARELTKLHEEIRRGTLEELAAYYSEHPPRGEIVIVVAPGEAPAVSQDTLREEARGMLSAGMSPREVQRALISQHGASRNVAYRLAHQPTDTDPANSGSSK